jgi:ubiquinone/menaquinone biosynthesis C-methylase UbiE
MADHEHHSHAAGHHHDHNHVEFDEATWARWAASAELEGEVLLDFVTSTAERVSLLPGWVAPRRIADVGSGPGVAACELARFFPDAEVIAFDSSRAMLEHAAARIDRLGFGGAARVELGEIPGDLDRLSEIDLLWASMSLHHVGDEVAALRAFRPTLSPAGVIAIAEMADQMRMLPEDLGVGRPGLGDRLAQCGAEWFAQMRLSLPSSVEGQDLALMVEAAGFTVLDDRVARIRIDGPLPDQARQFVVGTLERTRSQLDERLDAEDVAVLDVLLDPSNPLSVAQRDDVFVDATRRIVIARA